MMIRFHNFPWFVPLDQISARILAIRKWGEFDIPKDAVVEDIIKPGDEFCVRVRERVWDDHKVVDCRLYL